MHRIDKVFRVRVHQQQVVARLHLHLVAQVHGHTGNLEIELLPVHALAFPPTTIDRAV